MNQKRKFAIRMAAWLMCFAMVLTTINLPMFTTTVKAASDKAEDVRVYTPELQELLDAVELGLGTYVDDASEVSYSQYAQMLQRLVEVCCPDEPEKLEEWKNKYPKVWSCTDKIDRANAMYLIYACVKDVIGGEYYNPENKTNWMLQEWGNINSELSFDFGEDFPIRWDYYSDATTEELSLLYETDTISRHANSYFYALQKRALNGHLLFDYDRNSNSMRTQDILTMQEAMWSVIRVYESIEPFDIVLNQSKNLLSTDKNGADADKIYHYNEDIITDDLLLNAGKMESLKPSLNTDDMPYYTGIHYAWGSTGFDDTVTSVDAVAEAKFREAADLGFNYVRVVVTCKTFFDIGDSEHLSDAKIVQRYKENYIDGGHNEAILNNDETAIVTVDLAALNKLDEIVSYGLKYGLHINVQFFDYPGHIMLYTRNDGEYYEMDFAANPVKQQQVGQMWSLIAERYKGISNNVLSFTITHETNRGECSTKEAVKAGTKVVYDAIREVDQNRFLYQEESFEHDLGQYSDLDDDGIVDVATQVLYDGSAYNYWDHFADMAGAMGQSYGEVSSLNGYFAYWPSYWVPQANHGDKKIEIDGFLPAGTTIKMKGTAFVSEPYQVSVKQSDDDTEIFSQTFSEETPQNQWGGWGFDITFELNENTDGITIDMGIPTDKVYSIYRETFCVTLPEQYARTKYYENGYLNVYWGDWDYSSVEKRETAEIGFKINGDEQSIPNIKNMGEDGAPVETAIWKLDDNDNINIYINEDGSYQTNYGYTEEVIEKAIALQKKMFLDRKTSGVNLELYLGRKSYEQDVEGFLNTLIKNYKKNNLSWVFYPEETMLFLASAKGGVQKMYDGYRINQSLYEVMKPYFGEHPTFYITVPDKKNEINDYCVNAVLYNDEECTEQKENLGLFNSIDSLNKALGKKSGYLYVENYSPIANELPYGENLDGVTLSCPNGLEFTSDEITLSSDIKVLNDIHIADTGMTINGNGHQLILEASGGGITISGGNLHCDNLSIALGGNGYVIAKSNIDGLSDLMLGYLKDGYILDKDNIDDAWSNIVGNTVLINEGSINVNTLCTYGKDIYMLKGSKLATKNVGGIYGNVVMQMNEDGTLPELTVEDSMKDMVWQLRIQIFKGSLSKDDYVVSATTEESCPQSTVLAYIPNTADLGVKDKIGFLPTQDAWDIYSNRLLQDGRLYYDDGSTTINHLWESDYTEDVSATCGTVGKKSIHCSVCDATMDVTEIPATGNHDFTGQPYVVDEDGIHHNQTCKACGTVVKGKHDFSKYVSNADATHKVECKDCGAIQDGRDKDACSGGTATCTAKATLTANGKKETKCTFCGKVTKTETIYAAKTIKLSATKYTYDGKVKKPSVTIKDSKGNAIASTNYTVTYPSGRKNVGKYTVKVTFKGNYSGSKNLTFTINPPRTSISKVAAGKKAFTVKWAKKTTQVTGYEIQYSTSSSFAKGNKTVKVTSAKTVSKTISKLTGGKKYYVRIRTYKTVGKTPYYSDWSAKKSVTTKK